MNSTAAATTFVVSFLLLFIGLSIFLPAWLIMLIWGALAPSGAFHIAFWQSLLGVAAIRIVADLIR